VTKVWVSKLPGDKTIGRQSYENLLAAGGRPAKTTYSTLLYFFGEKSRAGKIHAKH
jgi:hypothetical protein